VPSGADGRVRAIDCWGMAQVAKLAGAPAHPEAGVRILRGIGELVSRGDPLFEIHAQSTAQLEFASAYVAAHAGLYAFGY
jgi:thymidine phosphorylase